jgi:hypothetical protein
MKTCRRCGETKPAAFFDKDSGTRDGLRGTCRECERHELQTEKRQLRSTAGLLNQAVPFAGIPGGLERASDRRRAGAPDVWRCLLPSVAAL